MASSADIIAKRKCSIVGIGRLGLCTGLLWANRAQWDVLGVDIFPSYVESINTKTLRSREPRVTTLLRGSTSLRATMDLDAALNHSDMIFVLVATPNGAGRHSYDHSTLSRVLENINARRVVNKHVVICCTVLPGYIAKYARYLLRDCPGVTVSYHPEFIAQGMIVHGLLRPDVVLIGEGSAVAGDVIEHLACAVAENEPKVHRMSPESAEICKLALNCFITTKISFANMIGDLADVTDAADKFDILRCVGDDQRVGPKCLRPGYGFGGPCFPRDNRALGNYMETMGIDTSLPRGTDAYNKFHAAFMARQVVAEAKKGRRRAAAAGAAAAADGGAAAAGKAATAPGRKARVADNIWLDTPSPGTITFEDIAYKPKCAINMIEESQPLAVAAAVARAEGGPRVNIRGRKGLVDLVRREFAGEFDYEVVEDAGVSQQGWQTIEEGGARVEQSDAGAVGADGGGDDEGKAAAGGITMGNPLSSYKR